MNMVKEYLIRKATLKDLEAVYDLICRLEERPFPFPAFQHLFGVNVCDEFVAYYVAEGNGHVIGFGSVHISKLLHHCGEVGEIQELIVCPEYRGTGIGKSLVKEMASWARGMGAVQLEVTCHLHRKEAHEFYQSLSFEYTHKKFVWSMR